MPLSSYYKPYTKRTITYANDGGGGQTETPVDTTIQGYLWNMSSHQILASAQIKENAECFFATNEALTLANKIVDATTYSTTKTYEVVGESNNYPNEYIIYKLKTISI